MFSHLLSIGPLSVFCLALFAGAFTNGLAGLAFAAVSGGFVLMLLPAQSTVAILASGGLLLQVCNNIHYVKEIQWRRIAIYVIPGFAGIPLGHHLLQVLPKPIIALMFGIVLLVYVVWTLFRKPVPENDFGGRIGEVIAGFIDGLFAGLLALPGIPVIIWSNLRGYGKAQQRALSVPINFLLLLGSMAMFGFKGNLANPVTQVHLLVAVPVALLGWSIGVRCFGRISEVNFRRFISGVLVISGFALVIPSANTLLAQHNPMPQSHTVSVGSVKPAA
ncbi:sulfite exporter TauE/SafE family protein [Burkholderia multivorans]|uniref:sulfite exporter TauE/SafE family protein n=1 Tax=Burkholderia multivorans TaxID=87883 RepID=UPI001C23CEAE|nr:sulfite exporter TauE/SafE family protein [Burkholderia multivorans]MBU9200028.1 sulfite exporter TauE/SafE family protein [Burkholderia multivorans]MDN8078853.1 sulfite exporter TauE/SafE family protein [Burkholderia multivorans]